jgi:hypothetical protein
MVSRCPHCFIPTQLCLFEPLLPRPLQGNRTTASNPSMMSPPPGSRMAAMAMNFCGAIVMGRRIHDRHDDRNREEHD